MAAPTVRNSRGPSDIKSAAPRFILLLGPEHTGVITLPTTGSLSIGRDEDADVRIVDALTSRAHARLYLGEQIEIEDLGSANGTRLRDERIPAHQRFVVSPGEAIAIGTTTLVFQRREPPFKARRIWPHGHFELRLIETCAEAETAKSTFAVLRLRVTRGAPPLPNLEETILSALRPGDVLAGYGPDEYEALLVDTDRGGANAIAGKLIALLDGAALAPHVGMGFFSDDATTPDGLLGRATDRMRGTSAAPPTGAGIVLENAAMRALYALAQKVAKGTINVLILGETGAGKEILAEAVHRASPRAAGPFVCLNCAALSDALLESELFGYEKGAFTGAMQAKAGLLEVASGGTLFLDEIGEMSLSLQAKALRAIETKQVLRVGATKPRAVDVRFVSATNRDLEEEVAAKRFREDLFFRLNGVSLVIPPLRDRVDELPALARRFLELAAASMGQTPPRISPDALAMMASYAWPGNLRELRNAMERAMLLSSGETILTEHLPVDRMKRAARGGLSVPPTPVQDDAPAAGDQRLPSALSMIEIERQAIVDALVRCAGNQSRAAELLGMPRRTFCKRLAEYKIPRPQP